MVYEREFIIVSNVKRIIPSIFIQQGKAVRWFDQSEIIDEDVIALAKQYCALGADELIIFDLSTNDQEHDNTIDLIKKICREVSISIIAGGNIKRQEDVKKILYAGAKRAILNLNNPAELDLLEEVSKRFGKEKIAVMYATAEAFNEDYTSEIIVLNGTDLESVKVNQKLETVILTDTMEKQCVIESLGTAGINGISGQYVSQKNFDIYAFKAECESQSIRISLLESRMDFSEFKLNSDGLIPTIVQDYKTGDVLMLAYMNKESYEQTIKTGKMTYYSRSRQSLWLKGETSGHYQYLRSMTLDCDNDTILAKVEQIGVACHTGAPSCFFQPLVESDFEEMNPLEVFQSVYDTIVDRKLHPKEGSYTNYLFDKGIDKILKKVGEEATELVIAAKNPNPEEIKYELSDFLYHAMVLMVERGVTWEDIIKELADR